jgi:peptide/nickel transport system permease protein
MPERPADSALSEGLPDAAVFHEAPAEVLADAVVAAPGGVAGEVDEVLRRRLGPAFWVAVGWLVLITLLAALAPVLPLEDPDQVGAGAKYEGFNGEHWLGTDTLGRDVLARTVFGARVSLVVGFAAVAGGLVVGGLLGLIAGYKHGWFERLVMGMADVLLSFPAVVLALAIVTFLGRDMSKIVLTLFILSIAPITRLARANTLQWSQREFVLAARTLGAKDRRILFREVLPNVLMPMASLALIGVAIAIVAEGTLAFLNLGIANEISWGKLVFEGKEALDQNAPHVPFVPASAMFLTVLSLNFAGDRLRAHFDVKEGLL